MPISILYLKNLDSSCACKIPRYVLIVFESPISLRNEIKRIHPTKKYIIIYLFMNFANLQQSLLYIPLTWLLIFYSNPPPFLFGWGKGIRDEISPPAYIYGTLPQTIPPLVILAAPPSPRGPTPAADTSAWTLHRRVISFCMLLTLIHRDPVRDRSEPLHKTRIKISSKGKSFFRSKTSATATVG